VNLKQKLSFLMLPTSLPKYILVSHKSLFWNKIICSGN